MVRVTFVMEQHVGHYTYYQNLRRYIESTAMIEATWVPVTYYRADGLWERLALMPGGLRAALRGRAQVRQGIAEGDGGVLFFNTQVPAALAHGMLRGQPYLISTDVTPLQYDRIGEAYGHRSDRAGPLKDFKRFVNGRMFRGATRVLPWSRWVGDSLVRDYGVDPGKVEVVPPGIDLG